MTLLLIGSQSLQPYLDRLSAHTGHDIQLQLLAGELSPDAQEVRQLIAQNQTGFDAILLLDGAAVVLEDGLTAGPIPLIIPRVHNQLSLLLGVQAYRRLWAEYDGKLSYSLPGCARELFICPAADCEALCYIADLELGLRETGLAARIIAQHHNWDYLEEAADLTLLTRLLTGNWDSDEILCVAPGETVLPSYRHNLLD